MASPPAPDPSSDHVRSLQSLYADVTSLHSLERGKDISMEERLARGTQPGAMDSLVYGETPFSAIAAILAAVVRLTGWPGGLVGRTFVDLGTGSGKPLVAAALLAPGWRECVGVELLPGLVDAALELEERFREGLPHIQKGVKGLQYRVPPAARSTPLRVEQGDVLEVDWWSTADVVFACSTCFEEPLLAGIAARAERLRPGSVIVMCSAALASPYLRMLEETRMVMSWGPATVYIAQRVAPGEEGGPGCGGGEEEGGEEAPARPPPLPPV